MVTAVVAAAASGPVNQVLPVVTGSAVQGQTLTVTAGIWAGSPAPTLSEQWQRCDGAGANCTDIAGATGSSYQPVAADLGATTRVTETATNPTGSSAVTSMVTAVVAAAASGPVNQVLPVVTGSAVQGQTLTVTAGSWAGSPAPTLSEQWQRCDGAGANCADIAGATGSSYQPVAADLGATTRVTAETATNPTGSSAVTSMVTAVVAAAATVAPTTPVLDNFNRANGSVGANWALIKTTGFSAMNIAGNAAVDPSSTAFTWNYWKAATFGPNSEAYVTISSYAAGDVIRIGARVSGGGTNTPSGYYVAVSATGVWSILRIDNGGTPVTLATGVTQPLATGDGIAIRIVGSVVTALHRTTATGWVQVLSYDTSNDSVRYTAAGRLALEFRTSTLDDFGGGTIP